MKAIDFGPKLPVDVCAPCSQHQSKSKSKSRHRSVDEVEKPWWMFRARVVPPMLQVCDSMILIDTGDGDSTLANE